MSLLLVPQKIPHYASTHGLCQSIGLDVKLHSVNMEYYASGFRKGPKHLLLPQSLNKIHNMRIDAP